MIPDAYDPLNWGRIIGGVLVFGLLLIVLVWQVRKQWFERKKWLMFLNNKSTPAIIENLTGFDFEVWVQQLFLSLGISAEVTGRQKNDHGIDVVAHYKGKRIAIQCKKFRPTDNVKWKVGETVIRGLYGVKWGDKYDMAIVITTGNFTWEAIEWAKGKKDLKLVNGYMLGKILTNRKLLVDLLES
jgi:restriction system protein